MIHGKEGWIVTGAMQNKYPTPCSAWRAEWIQLDDESLP
jgi:hypothetical protein